MSFSVRVAKGVRVGVSSRGVRTSVRAGPLYYSVGSGGGRPRSTLAAAQSQLRAADKANQAQVLHQTLEQILHLHRQEFAPAQRPVAALTAVDEAAIRTRHDEAALTGLNIFKRSQRAEAHRAAADSAAAEINEAREHNAAHQQSVQRQLDERWQRLLANDPGTTLEALTAAFGDNEAAAAPINVEAGEATLVVLAPGVDTIPERYPTLTPAGNLTLKKMTKAERSSFYKLLVCGHVLATIKEAFAVAPALQAARAVVLRTSPADAYGRSLPEVLLAGRWLREALDGVRWNEVDAGVVVNDTAQELLINQKGAVKELTPLELAKEPALSELVAAVDFDDLATR